jgi:hypothetical protein
MTWIRRVTLALLLAASVAVLLVAVVELWNYRQWDYLPLHAVHSSEPDQRARALEDRVEILTRRVGDMELLVMVLLGSSGLYAIVFVVTSYFSAMGFARQADRAIAHIQDQIGIALGDLRELQEDTQRKLDEGPALSVVKAKEFRAELRAMIQEELTANQESAPRPAMHPAVNHDARIAAMLAKTSAWSPEKMDDRAKLELLQFEDEAARLEIAGAPEPPPALASLYRSFARLYSSEDQMRARHHLTQALRLAPADSPLASELHYDLACWFAADRDFEHAMGELSAAFQHQSRALDDRLAIDIDEGGKLDELASTPPFDKALNDLLLNVSVP